MKRILPGSALLLTFCTSFALDTEQPEVRSFIEEMVAEHDFERDALTTVLADAEIKQGIIDAISKPAEKTFTWAEYRKIFITPERVAAGVTFWQEHCEMLAQIAADSGVPAEILIGIIGVETYFGRITGKYRVLDALSTLAFKYPPRAGIFPQGTRTVPASRSRRRHAGRRRDRLLCRRNGQAAVHAFQFSRLCGRLDGRRASATSGTTGRTWPAASPTISMRTAGRATITSSPRRRVESVAGPPARPTR